MKTIKILLFILCVSFTTTTQAQNNDKSIIKVNYTSGCVSDFMVDLLKKQIKDAHQFTGYLKMMEKYHVYSRFYLNVNTNESVYVMDSIAEVQNLQAAGHVESIHINSDGNIVGKEIFMGKNIDFTGNIDEIKWTITNETKEINGYECKKAHIADDEGVYVWFTPEIAVNGGPYVFFGLPGLVLETNSPFNVTNVASISYANEEEFQSVKNQIIANAPAEKTIPIEEVFAKKLNFRRIMEMGTE